MAATAIAASANAAVTRNYYTFILIKRFVAPYRLPAALLVWATTNRLGTRCSSCLYVPLDANGGIIERLSLSPPGSCVTFAYVVVYMQVMLSEDEQLTNSKEPRGRKFYSNSVNNDSINSSKRFDPTMLNLRLRSTNRRASEWKLNMQSASVLTKTYTFTDTYSEKHEVSFLLSLRGSGRRSIGAVVFVIIAGEPDF